MCLESNVIQITATTKNKTKKRKKIFPDVHQSIDWINPPSLEHPPPPFPIDHGPRVPPAKPGPGRTTLDRRRDDGGSFSDKAWAKSNNV